MTTPVVEILRDLEERGIEAVPRGEDKLVLRGDAVEDLDELRMARIKAHKPEILAYLRQVRITHPARWSSTATLDESEALTDWSELVKRPRPDPYTLDAGAVADWIERSALPPAPFEVRPGETVLDVERYVAALLRELRREPALREPHPFATLDQGRAFLRYILGEPS